MPHLADLSQFFVRIQVCLSCGSTFGLRGILISEKILNKSRLCEFCEEQLLETELQSGLKEYKFKTWSLIQWVDGNVNLSRQIAMQMKQSQKVRNYYWYAHRLLSQRMKKSIVPNNLYFVPAPSRVKDWPDHAFCFAQALSEIACGQLAAVLLRTESSSQKSKGIQLRRRDLHTRMKLKPNISKGDVLDRNVVFVDDLITSGATAEAAHIALGQPKNFEVWTIFQRPRLRPG